MCQTFLIAITVAGLGLAPPVAKPLSDTGLPPLGSLSEREESGGRGPGVVSTGKGDAGGVSYGTYQMTSLGPKGLVGGTVATLERELDELMNSEVGAGDLAAEARLEAAVAAQETALRDAQRELAAAEKELRQAEQQPRR